MSGDTITPDSATPWDPETEYVIESSTSPVSVDGYAKGEPKYIACPHCGAANRLTREASAGIDCLVHTPGCPNWRVHSRWFREQD